MEQNFSLYHLEVKHLVMHKIYNIHIFYGLKIIYICLYISVQISYESFSNLTEPTLPSIQFIITTNSLLF